MIYLHTTLATVPTDVFYVQVDPAVGNYICSGAVNPQFPGNGSVLLGRNFTNYLASLGVLDQYVAPGAAVTLQCAVLHANGVSFDSVLSAAWTWDPTGGLYILQQLGLAQASPSGLLQTTYKNAP